jgi:RNA polymerase sigma-54 factor
LQDVADGRISNISRALKLSTLEVRKCIEQIAKLNPRPMSAFLKGHSNYIMPDIIFLKEREKWEVELNDEWVEDYRINDYYLQMLKTTKDEELAEYFRNKLERVRFVMNSIQQRRQTILAISNAVLERQKEYMEGIAYLKPMTMADVAGELGIHTSTVSRAIKGKYIQYPGGTILMKNLFSTPVSAAEGEEGVGVMQIKEMIREMIDMEDKKKPYSDQAIVCALREKQVSVSRRAVAKYREEMGIKGSYDRKLI